MVPHVVINERNIDIPPHHKPTCRINVNEANTGNLIFGYGINSNTGCTGCISGLTPAGTPTVSTCSITTVKPAAKVRVAAMPGYDDRLEMCVGDETCIRGKKLSIQVGDNGQEITLSRFDDRIRVRGEELKATADCVRTEGKDRLILEGEVVMHYKRDGRAIANVMRGDHIELNLSNGAVTIKSLQSIGHEPVNVGVYTDTECK